MANHAGTKKAIRKTVRKTAINKNRKSRIKTYIKRVITAVEYGSSEEANKALVEAQSEIMTGVACNLIKKNTGARKVSRLVRKVKAISVSIAKKAAPKPTTAKASAAKKVSSEVSKEVKKLSKEDTAASKSVVKKSTAATAKESKVVK